MARPLGGRRRTEATALPGWIKPQLTKLVDQPPELFGLPESKDHFGLGYRRVAANDKSPPPPADAVKIVEFDHAAPTDRLRPAGSPQRKGY